MRCFVKDKTGRSCLLELRDSILREESGVSQAFDGQGGNDPVQSRPNLQDAQWNCCANIDK